MIPSSILPELLPIEGGTVSPTSNVEHSSRNSSLAIRRVYSIGTLLSLRYTTPINRRSRRALFALQLWSPCPHSVLHNQLVYRVCVTTIDLFKAALALSFKVCILTESMARLLLFLLAPPLSQLMQSAVNVIRHSFITLQVCVAIINAAVLITTAAYHLIIMAPQNNIIHSMNEESDRVSVFTSYRNDNRIQRNLISKLKVASINVNGLFGKLEMVELVLRTHNIDIMCLQETKLNESHLDSTLNFTDYNLYRKDRNIHGGGVCIYVRTKYNSSMVFNNKTCEIIGIKMNLHGKPVHVFSVYKPPNVNPDIFYEDLVDIVTFLLDENSTVIIAGDTNMNIFESQKKDKVEKYCNEMCLKNWINTPTHKDSCIDHLMVSKGTEVRNIQFHAPVEKWHVSITCEVYMKKLVNKDIRSTPTSLPNWKRAAWDAMDEWIKNQNLPLLIEHSKSVEECWLIQKLIYEEAIRLFVPNRIIDCKQKYKSWISKATIKSLHRKDRLYAKWKISNCQRKRSSFEKARKNCKKLLIQDKRRWVEHTFNRKNTNTFWLEVRKLTKQSVRSGIPELHESENIARTEAEKADMLRNIYLKSWSSSELTTEKEHGPGNYEECAPKWVLRQLKILKVRKAHGPDGLPPIFLKRMAPLLAHPIARVITLSWVHGQIPDDWKKAIVIPIPKKGTSSNPIDYRPISLTSVVSKIAERFVCLQIIKQIEDKLPNQQYGFRAGRGTTEALVAAEHTIIDAMEKCVGKPSRAAIISFDIQKAFDSISHERILCHLKECFELSLNGRRWLEEFLTQRSFCVRVGSTYSRWSFTSRGVPQGTVLGPILFNAATAGLKNLQLTKDSTIILYADDLLLVKPLPSQTDEEDLQTDCNTILSFYEGEKLKLNGSKTELLLTSVAPGGAPPLHNKITLGGSDISITQELKYLGILFDQRMTFAKHASWVSGKARKMLGAIRRVLKRWKLSKQIHQIYLSCIRPVITYGVAVSYPRTKEGQRVIERVNKIAAEMILNKYNQSYNDILIKLKWDPIKWIAIQDQMRLMMQLVQKITMCDSIPLIIPDTSRHSRRISNDKPFKAVGVVPRLHRTKETTVNQMVHRWSLLPNDVIHLNQQTFMEKISSSEVKTILIREQA
jgi:hypothetical protein